MSVTIDDIRAAAALLRGAIEHTPTLHSRTLSELTGSRVVLKFENLQFTASFKERGACVRLNALAPEERARGVIAMSAGNHAQAVAYHARRLGISSTIVMPRHTPTNKVEHTRRFGAEVLLRGEDLSEAADVAVKLAAERGLTLVHPYDDEKIIAGQGTVALEVLQDCPDVEILVVPVGGGGLIAGNALAAKSLRPDIEIVGVETRRYPSMRQALDGEPIRCGRHTIAEGIAVKEPGRITREIIREHVDEILLVEEVSIERALLLLLEVEKTVVEGAGAVGLAALLEHGERFRGRTTALILSGGNIDLFPLSTIIQRGLVRHGQLARLTVTLEDRAGALGALGTVVGATDAVIVEVHHQRNFTGLPMESVAVEMVLRTRGRDHLDQVIAALERDGFEPHLAEADRRLLDQS